MHPPRARLRPPGPAPPGASAPARDRACRREHGQARLVELDAQLQEVALAAEQHHAHVEALPALHAGHDAQETHRRRHGGQAQRRARLHLLDESARRGEPVEEEGAEVGAATPALGAEPAVRNQLDRSLNRLERPLGQPLVGVGQRPGQRQQHVLGQQRHRGGSGLGERLVAVLAKERGAAGRSTRFARATPADSGCEGCGSNVRHEGVEPDHVGRPVGVERWIRGQSERQRAGKEVHAQVGAGAGLDQTPGSRGRALRARAPRRSRRGTARAPADRGRGPARRRAPRPRAPSRPVPRRGTWSRTGRHRRPPRDRGGSRPRATRPRTVSRLRCAARRGSAGSLCSRSTLVRCCAPPMAQAGNKRLVLVAMIFAVAMTFIDQTIVAIAVPELQKDLSLSATGVQWIINGYLLALSALFAFGGRLADIAGHRRMVLIGVVIFATASALCGATPTGSAAEAWLITFRVIQGAGRGADVPRRSGDRGRGLPAARARQGDGDLLRRHRRPHRRRTAGRRLPHRHQLAGDLLGQHPGGDRRRGVDAAGQAGQRSPPCAAGLSAARSSSRRAWDSRCSASSSRACGAGAIPSTWALHRRRARAAGGVRGLGAACGRSADHASASSATAASPWTMPCCS